MQHKWVEMLHKWKPTEGFLIRYKSSRRWTYLTRVLRLILVDQVHQEEPAWGSHQIRQEHISSTTPWVQHSQVVGQVVLLQGVGFKPVRRPVKVVIPDAADETFSLSRAKRGGVGGESEAYLSCFDHTGCFVSPPCPPSPAPAGPSARRTRR